MTGYIRSPRLLKAGLVLVDPESGAIDKIITLQYNAETLTRSIKVQAGGDNAPRSQALRIHGPAVETFTLEAMLDATDALGAQSGPGIAGEVGLFPQIAAMESLVQPTSAQLRRQDVLAAAGSFEIAPMETPLSLFVWSRSRILPVRVTDLSVTEEAFDPNLNPIRAKVSLGLRSLSVDDLGFSHRGGGLFMAYLTAKEQLARRAPAAGLAALGLGSLP